MIIDIEDELFHKVKQIVKSRNVSIFEQLEKLEPIATDTNTLQKARDTKTQKVKQSIKEMIKTLYSVNIEPTKYQLNKRTGIAYVTLSKYYDELIEEVQNARDEH